MTSSLGKCRQKLDVEREWGAWRAWRRPTLPPLSEAVPWALRVFTAEFGMGSGVWPLAMATRPGKPPCDVIGWGRQCLGAAWALALHGGGGVARGSRADGSSRSERLVPVSCTGCPASTSGLSTWWSTTALGETWF